jgi:radical SAM protein with 4Fe4S-binding SPASM domain
MNGLQGINIELTSRCNKECFMCGRRKLEKDNPELVNWGDMPITMVEKIAPKIPKGVFVQLHNSGEPLLYEYLREALSAFSGHYLGLNTNGKLLMEKADIIRMSLSSVTISIIPDDPEGKEQLEIAKMFLQIPIRPKVVFRLLGKIDTERKWLLKQWSEKYDNVLLVKRILHKPEGSFGYEKEVTIPEIGICLEMLHKLAIDRFGNVYPCVRFDPEKKNLLGNVNSQNLESMWTGAIRKQWIRHHIAGCREKAPLCGTCDFYGVPRG